MFGSYFLFLFFFLFTHLNEKNIVLEHVTPAFGCKSIAAFIFPFSFFKTVDGMLSQMKGKATSHL